MVHVRCNLDNMSLKIGYMAIDIDKEQWKLTICDQKRTDDEPVFG